MPECASPARERERRGYGEGEARPPLLASGPASGRDRTAWGRPALMWWFSAIHSPPSLKDVTIAYCGGLTSLQSRSGELPSLKNLTVISCKTLSSLPDGPQAYSSLRYLEIRCCPGMKTLPVSLQQRLGSIPEKNISARFCEDAPKEHLSWKQKAWKYVSCRDLDAQTTNEEDYSDYGCSQDTPSPRYLVSEVTDEEEEDATLGYDGTDTAADASLSFRVICLAKYQTQLVLFVFSSSGPLAQQWHTTVFEGWSALIAETSQGDDMRSATAFGKRYYVHGCFCWAIPGINKLLMLDIATMDFSSINLPPSTWYNSQVAFVEARDGRLGMLILSNNRLLYTILVGIGDDPKQWQMWDVGTLRPDCCYYFIGAAGGYLLLQEYPDDPYEMPGTDCFSLNLQTMQLERFCRKEFMMLLQGHLYVGFPPSLSPPTI
ncbi:hypothetical protein TRIUR3_02722 [Triticum urartu]|uniref:Uncharacterized protein n=1 Tax=Triticum urartu TaxID=4572 RepID=M7YBT6_TRIUA|nr:hypothetical protein TRIUR3_02722 [Triticum urartu]